MVPRRSVGATGFRALSGLLIPGAIVFSMGTAQAQVQPSPPTREEVTRPAPDRPEQTGPRLTVEGDVGRGSCALDRPEYQNIRFTLTNVAFDDLRGISAEALRPAYSNLIGQDVPIATICEIRDRAAAILTEAGYVAAVEVPEQRITDGTVRFQVLMARLVGLRVRGDAGRGERLIAAYLQRLTQQEVFNRYEAERYLLLAGDLPGYNVRLALRSAGAARGEVIGEVIVQRYSALADVTVQNYGSREVGRWGVLLRGQVFGLTGLGDRTSLALFATPDLDEQRTLQVAHDFRVGSEGLTFGGQFTYSWAQPDLGDPLIDIRSRTLFASLEASYPFIRRQSSTLRGSAGFDLVDQDVQFNDFDLNRDRLRVIFARLTYDAVGLATGDPRYTALTPRWRFGAVAEARQGLSLLGASDGCGAGFINCLAPNVVPPSRFEGDPTAFVLRGNLSGEFRPDPQLTFAVAARGQYSGNPLLSFEEFSAGNYTIGRGYDPGALLGDSGVGVQAEVRFGRPIPRGPDRWAFEAFAFVDQAWAWNEDRLFVVPDAELTSVGGGIRAAWGDRLRIEAMVAAPLDRTPLQAQRGDPRFLITITTRLLPWSFR